MYTNGVQFLSAPPNNDTLKRGAVPVVANSQITEGKLHQRISVARQLVDNITGVGVLCVHIPPAAEFWARAGGRNCHFTGCLIISFAVVQQPETQAD
jgi:hypothetical protein